jgi:hypothetical protein
MLETGANWDVAMQVLKRAQQGRIFDVEMKLDQLTFPIEPIDRIPDSGWDLGVDGSSPASQAVDSYYDVRDRAENLFARDLMSRPFDQYRKMLVEMTADPDSSVAAGIEHMKWKFGALLKNWILCDYTLIAGDAVVRGLPDGLCKRLLECYRCGFMPVGWMGSISSGVVLVVDPVAIERDPAWNGLHEPQWIRDLPHGPC